MVYIILVTGITKSYFYNAFSWLLPIGYSQYSWQFLGVVYVLILCWLFIGIAIISDIFMEGIEVITSTTFEVTVTDNMGY